MTVPIQWRTKKQRYSLQGGVCPKCSNMIFPPRGVCPFCAREDAALGSQVSGAGHSESRNVRSLVFVAPVGMEQTAVAAAGDD